MEEISGLEFDDQSEQLYIHFGVEDHFLKLDTFIRTAESARRIIEALDSTFFQGSLVYEFIVLPPESGTFLSRLAIWVGGGVGAVFGFANTDIGSAYIENLTGQPPTYWAGQAGKISRNFIDDVFEHGEVASDAVRDEPAACQVGARIVIAMTRGVLEKETDQLEKIGMEIGELPDAIDARADFYLACLEDRDVKKIGFTPEDDFPIPRSSFPGRATKPERRDDEGDDLPWEVSIEEIYVTSPNWDCEDQKSRQWKGKNQIRRDCYFIIEDTEFWSLVKRKKLHVEVLDNLKVQWAYQIAEGRTKNRRVLRVLEFNGETLAEPLAPDAIRAVLGDYTTSDAPRDDSQTLFEWQIRN